MPGMPLPPLHRLLSISTLASAGGELGLKVVSVRPSNGALGLASLPATVMLFDEATGLLQCIMDATDLTAYRTAAGSALATSLLALDKSEKLAVFGAGKQVRSIQYHSAPWSFMR